MPRRKGGRPRGVAHSTPASSVSTSSLPVDAIADAVDLGANSSSLPEEVGAIPVTNVFPGMNPIPETNPVPTNSVPVMNSDPLTATQSNVNVSSSSSRLPDGWPWGKNVCRVEGGRLMPDKTIRVITKILQREIATEGYNWKNVPNDVKLRYWEEFQKVYTWDPTFSANVVKDLFFVHAADRYGDMLSKAKTNFRHTTERPFFASREAWDCWLMYWNDPEVEAKSQQASKNRLSSDGTGCSKHTGGSRSAVAHEKAYRDKHGKDPDVVDSFLTLHKRKDGLFVDEKSKRIAGDVESRISAAVEVGEEVDVNKVFISVVGGVKKRCVYGIGSLKHKYIDSHSSASSATSAMESATLRTQVEQLKQQLAERDANFQANLQQLAERDANMQANLKQALDEERAARTEMQTSFQVQINQFMEQLRQQVGPPSKP